MPVDKQVLLRYQILNKCFRNRLRHPAPFEKLGYNLEK